MPISNVKKLHHRISIVAAFVTALVIIICSGLLAYLNARTQDQAANVVMRTHRILAALNQIETTMTDAETGQRGYLLTGDPQFLEPYLAAIGADHGKVQVIHRPPIEASLTSIRQLIHPNGAEQAILDRIDNLAHRKLAELRETVALRQAGQTDAALAIVREGRGKRSMDALRVTLSNMRAEERRQLEHSESLRDQAADKAYLSAVLSCILSVLAIGVLVATARRLARQQRREKERFLMLADHISQHAWSLDTAGHFEWFNWRWKEYTGLHGEDLDGQWRVVTAHPAHHDRVERGLRHAVETGVPWEDIFPLHARDGTWHWFLVRAVPIRGGDGRVLRWFGTNTNIDERLRLEHELKDGNRRKDEFIATLAHELRNPLAPIQAGLELMRLSPLFPAPLANTREIMARQMKHLVRLIDDLLDVSRISSGKLELQRQLLPIRNVIDSALEVSRLHIASSGHALDVCVPAEPLMVNGDPVRLAQVLSNLLNNGAKYTPEGGLIRIVAERDDNDIVIRVVDNGIGIDAAVLPDIFDLFSQAHEASERRQGGIGIGLSIARKLVEMHGGSLTASSSGLGQGSTFVVRLPLARGMVLPAAEAAPLALPGAGTQQPDARRILILDDNVDAAQTLCMLFEMAGHTVVLAHTGREAISLAQRFQPEIGFLDIGLPDMDGYEVARALRQEPIPGLNLVALTGWGAAADRQRSAEAGFDHHLTKPVSLQALRDALPDLALPSNEAAAP
jgi:PAS domain S-box-containing protein